MTAMMSATPRARRSRFAGEAGGRAERRLGVCEKNLGI
ncbi:hypothetical protein DB31_2882 [Hyalangium minutum]|uniref:Uncharacterized protein n=1 Tax=Hyalangium minutum TaxID=394096 RepID=A0A085W6H6_9BACT|nr:hypothetical protein DB31_2882 [Hyalangium minutum]